jgi:hypothetical protein
MDFHRETRGPLSITTTLAGIVMALLLATALAAAQPAGKMPRVGVLANGSAALMSYGTMPPCPPPRPVPTRRSIDEGVDLHACPARPPGPAGLSLRCSTTSAAPCETGPRP